MEKNNQINEEIEQIDDKISAKIYKFQKEILLKIDLILNKSWETIWQMQISNFTNNIDFFRDKHLYKEIDPEHRNLWYWRKLLDLWIKHWGILPELEYDNTPSWVLFLLKSWYELVWYFEKRWVNNEFFKIDEHIKELEIEKIRKNIKQERVNNIYMLKKTAN